MRGALKINVLGRFSVFRPDGTECPLTTRKAQALLACLALEPEGTTRERAAHLLWGDRNDERARHNVRQVLSKVRAELGPIVVGEGDRLSLDDDGCQVDVREFQRLVRHDDAESLDAGLALYRGELLEGIAVRELELEAWLTQERERLRRIACEAMDRLVQQLTESGRDSEAMVALRRRLTMDPACEVAHRGLMDLLDRNGRRSEALRQYRLCVEALQRELGVEPEAETLALHRRIKGSDQGAHDIRLRDEVSELVDSGERPTVAVLPFDRLSADTDDYFADGITEDIITALCRFHSLQVIARGSSFVYKRNDAPDREIAEALGARFLVRGSVQQAGERIRLNVQLLDGPKGLNLWGERFDRELTDIFAVQDEITATVASTLADRVDAVERARVRGAPPERLAAYDIVLRGKDHHHRFTADDCATCIELFERAIDRDPGYAVAHAWLACGLGQALVFGLDDQARLVDRSQAAAERGLQLDPDEAECHRVLAQVSLTRGYLTRAIRHQEQALVLNPNDDRSVCSMGEFLSFAGRPKEAERWVRKSIRLNPYHPQRYWTHLARALFHQERFEECLQVLEQIGRPRQDDLAYAVAAAVELGDQVDVERHLDALRVAWPEFDADRFTDGLPYERDEDRDRVLAPLKAVGF